MAKNFNALKAALTPEAQSKVAQKTEQMLQEKPLQELRQTTGLSPKNDGRGAAYSATRRGKIS